MPAQIPTDELLYAILDELTIINKRFDDEDKDKDSKDKKNEVTFKVEGNEEVVALLTGMASLDAEKVKSMEDLSKNAESLCNSVKALAQINIKEVKEAVVTVGDLLTGLSALKVEDKHVDNLKISVETLSHVNEKIKEIAESLKDVNLSDASLDGFRQLIGIMDTINKMNAKGGGFASLSKVFNPIAALKIRFFLSMIAKAHTSGLNKEALESVGVLLGMCAAIGKQAKSLKKMVPVLKELEKLDPKNAGRIGEYIKELIDPIRELDPKEFKKVEKLMKSFNKTLMYIVGAIAVLTIIAMIDLAALAAGTIVLIGTLWSMTTFLIKLAKQKKGLDKGSEAVYTLAKAMLMIVGAIGLMSLIVTVFPLETLAFGTIIVLGVLWAVTGFAIKLSKSQKDLKHGKTAISQVADALLKVTVAIGIMALMQKVFDLKEILIGTGIVLLVMLALVGLTKMLAGGKDKDKSMQKAVASLTSLCKALMLVTLAIGIMALLVKMDLSAALIGSVIVLGIMFLMIQMVKSLAKIKDKSLKQATDAMIVITALMLAVSLMALLIFPKIAENVKDVLIGGLVVIGIITIMGLGVWALASIKQQDLKTATIALAVIAVVFLAVSLIANTILPEIAAQWKEAAIGGLIVMAIIGLMTLVVWGLASFKKEELMWGCGALAILTVIFLAVSLIAKEILIPIGEEWESAAKGGGVVIAIIGLMILGVFALNKIKTDNLKEGFLALVAMGVILWAIAELTQRYLIPIGEEWESAAKGGGVVVAIVGLMEAGLWALTKLDMKNMKEALASLVVMGLILWGVAELTQRYFIPIGKQWDDAAAGGGVVIGIIGIMSLILLAIADKLGKPSNGGGKEKILEATGLILLVGGLLWALAKILPPFIDLSIYVGKNIDTAAMGAGGIITLLGLVGTILYFVGKAASDKEIQKALLYGAATITGIGLVLGILGEVLPPFIELCVKVDENKAALARGALTIAGVLTGWGVLFGLIGALMMTGAVAAAVAAGAATIAGIGVVLGVLAEVLPPFIDLCVRVDKVKEELGRGALTIGAVLTGWGTLFGLVGALVLNPIVLLCLGAGMATIWGISKVMGALERGINSFIRIVKSTQQLKNAKAATDIIIAAVKSIIEVLKSVGKMVLNPFTAVCTGAGIPALASISTAMISLKLSLLAFGSTMSVMKKYTVKDMETFRDFIIDDKKGFIGIVTQIVEKFNDMGLKSAMMASIISQAIRPIFTTIKDFMTVIDAFSKMKYPTEFDEKGRATKFAPMTPEYFIKAAISISTSFSTFLTQLGKSMESWDFKKVIVLRLLSGSIGPVIKSISDFVSAVLKLTSGAIPTAWDKEGKPIKFRNVTPADFVGAALAVSAGFSAFLTELGPALNALGPLSLACMKSLSESVKPVMESVGVFANTIMEVIVGRDFEIPDPKDPNKTIKKHIDFTPGKFIMAALTICTAFTAFLETLYAGLKPFEYNNLAEQIIAGGGNTSKIGSLLKSLEGVGSVMDSVAKMCDLCVKVSEYMEKINLPEVGRTMASTVTGFLSNLMFMLGSDVQTEMVKKVADNSKTIETIVNHFSKIMNTFNSVYKNVEGNYPEFSGMYKDIINALIGPDISASYNAASKMIDETIMPLMVKYAKIINFFAKLELVTDSVKYQMSASSIKKHAEIMTDVVNNFGTALEHYKAGCESVDYSVFIKLGQSIGDMYDMVRNAYSKFNDSFSQLTKVLEQNVKKKFEPSMNKVIKLLVTTHKVWTNLDNLLLKKEKQRNAALERLKTHIDNIATSTDNLVQALKQVAENSEALEEAQRRLQAARQANEAARRDAEDEDDNKTPGNVKDGNKPGNTPKNPNDSKHPGVDPKMARLIDDMSASIAAAITAQLRSLFNNKQFTFEINSKPAANGNLTLFK